MAFKNPYELVKHVAFQLHDCELGHEFTRYPLDTLKNYLNLAVCFVFEYRPDLFAENRDIILVAGDCQTLPDDVSQLMEIDGVKLSTGENTNSATNADYDLQKAFPSSKCDNVKNNCIVPGRTIKSQPDYNITSYSYDPKNPGVFYVSPSVPAGQSITLTVQVVTDPPCYMLEDLEKDSGTKFNFDCQAIDPIVNYMLAKAHELDTESLQNAQWASYYMTQAWATLQRVYQQRSAFSSGWYLGQIGTGDEQARRR